MADVNAPFPGACQASLPARRVVMSALSASAENAPSPATARYSLAFRTWTGVLASARCHCSGHRTRLPAISRVASDMSVTAKRIAHRGRPGDRPEAGPYRNTERPTAMWTTAVPAT